MEHIFRAYDIRGIWNRDLDPSVCLNIGLGLGSFLTKDLGFTKVSVGYDVRRTSEAFHGALVSGLLSTGMEVLSLGRCGFGVALFGGMKENAEASLYITASHLEPEWNGLKMYFGDGVGFPEEHIISVRDRVVKKEYSNVEWDDMGSYREMDYLPYYVDFWSSRYSPFIKGKGMKMAVDCGGGAMCLSAVRVLEAAGSSVVPINSEVDPHFSQRPSEPKPKNLGKLRDAVLDGGLSFGVAFDGDGDRAVVVDDTGRFLSTDRLGIIIAKDLLGEEGGGLILANVESSMAVEDVLEPLGAVVKRIKVGHTYLTLEARENGALFGVERSGHLIVPKQVLFDDAIVAPLEILKILSRTGYRLSEIADGVPEYPSDSSAFDCPDNTKFGVVEELRTDLTASFGKVNTMDGVRVDTEEGWVLIRCSNTSPVIRMTVEGRSQASLEALKVEFGKILKEAIDRIEG
ncbi:MAG: hypothetical protein ACMUIE_08785 [Thermoplasmatota archaeon]